MNDRMWIGTCAGPRDVLLVRSLLDAYGIPVMISGEHLFSLQPWYLGVFRTDVFVSAADAEDAAAILADSRSGDHALLDDSDIPVSAIEVSDQAADAQWLGWPPHPWCVAATDRWHQTGLALLFGLITGFGAAHFYYTRAWLRGLALAFVQLGAGKVLDDSKSVLDVLILARIVDVVGALWLLWSAPRARTQGGPTQPDELPPSSEASSGPRGCQQ
jgi:hypothetical protein